MLSDKCLSKNDPEANNIVFWIKLFERHLNKEMPSVFSNKIYLTLMYRPGTTFIVASKSHFLKFAEDIYNLFKFEKCFDFKFDEVTCRFWFNFKRFSSFSVTFGFVEYSIRDKNNYSCQSFSIYSYPFNIKVGAQGFGYFTLLFYKNCLCKISNVVSLKNIDDCTIIKL